MPSIPCAGTHPISHRPVVLTSKGGCVRAGLSGRRNQTKAQIPNVFPLHQTYTPKSSSLKTGFSHMPFAGPGRGGRILGFLKEGRSCHSPAAAPRLLPHGKAQCQLCHSQFSQPSMPQCSNRHGLQPQLRGRHPEAQKHPSLLQEQHKEESPGRTGNKHQAEPDSGPWRAQ